MPGITEPTPHKESVYERLIESLVITEAPAIISAVLSDPAKHAKYRDVLRDVRDVRDVLDAADLGVASA